MTAPDRLKAIIDRAFREMDALKAFDQNLSDIMYWRRECAISADECIELRIYNRKQLNQHLM